MDHAKQLKELDTLVGRAKRAGLTVHHYPEERLAIFRVPLPKVATSEAASPDGAAQAAGADLGTNTGPAAAGNGAASS